VSEGERQPPASRSAGRVDRRKSAPGKIRTCDLSLRRRVGEPTRGAGYLIFAGVFGLFRYPVVYLKIRPETPLLALIGTGLRPT
jgi:hypothetical protein